MSSKFVDICVFKFELSFETFDSVATLCNNYSLSPIKLNNQTLENAKKMQLSIQTSNMDRIVEMFDYFNFLGHVILRTQTIALPHFSNIFL